MILRKLKNKVNVVRDRSLVVIDNLPSATTEFIR